VAITDHDTINGVEKGMRAGREFGIEVVPGVEISVDSPGGSMHMVGLFIDYLDRDLDKWLDTLRLARLERYPRIIGRLRELGIEITAREVEVEAGESVIGRPHIARVLQAKGVVKSKQDAFSRYLGSNAAAYIPRRRVASGEAIEQIHRAGGLAILAHFTTCCSDEEPRAARKILGKLRDQGLDGMETYYHSFTNAEHNRAVELARTFGFLQSGGSDFHGPAPKGFLLGRRLGMPHRLLKKLKNASRGSRTGI